MVCVYVSYSLWLCGTHDFSQFTICIENMWQTPPTSDGYLLPHTPGEYTVDTEWGYVSVFSKQKKFWIHVFQVKIEMNMCQFLVHIFALHSVVNTEWEFVYSKIENVNSDFVLPY